MREVLEGPSWILKKVYKKSPAFFFFEFSSDSKNNNLEKVPMESLKKNLGGILGRFSGYIISEIYGRNPVMVTW